MTDYTSVLSELKNLQNKKKALAIQKFFKTGPSEYSQFDYFLGINNPTLHRLVTKNRGELTLETIQQLLQNKYHEIRLFAVFYLVDIYTKTIDKEIHTTIYDVFLKNISQINNWDLVDASAHKILGHYLYHYQSEQKNFVLRSLAKSKNLWHRRIAIIATHYEISKYHDASTAIYLIKFLFHDSQDLIHKAIGWTLREIGKKIDQKLLVQFLDENMAVLPRTSLRYAIEHLSPDQRAFYLKK